MIFLTLEQVLSLQQRVIEQSGGATGIRDSEILASAVAQPYMTYDGQDLYPSLIEKVAALGFSFLVPIAPRGNAYDDALRRVAQENRTR